MREGLPPSSADTARSQARPDLEQLPAAPQIGDRVLRNARQDRRAPLQRKCARSHPRGRRRPPAHPARCRRRRRRRRLSPHADLRAAAAARADNITLGTACGKMFRCSVLTVTDPGDSDIVRSMPES